MTEIYPDTPPFLDIYYGGPVADWHYGEELYRREVTSENGHEYVGVVKRVRGGGIVWRVARDGNEMFALAAQSQTSAELSVIKTVNDLQTGECPKWRW